MFMRPLPSIPGFPVFGLSDDFTGLRWLCLWQREYGADDGDLVEVKLGHGHPEQGPWVLVTTARKQSHRGFDEHEIGPVGLGYAATSGVLHMFESATWASPAHGTSIHADERESVQHEIDLVGAGDDGTARLVHWEPTVVDIDGVDHPARLRRIDRGWAYVIDMPEVVVAVSGPTTMAPDRWRLTKVTEHLDGYATA